jgi:hypothetical protein
MSQHHFLIKYDTDVKEWSWDIETEMAVLPSSIYLPQEDMWAKPTYSKRIETLDNDLCEQVSYGLNYLNERKAI